MCDIRPLRSAVASFARMLEVTSADGTRIGCEVDGTGPALLLVHGSTADRHRWAAVRAALAERFTLVLMDRRGRGLSGDGPGRATRSRGRPRTSRPSSRRSGPRRSCSRTPTAGRARSRPRRGRGPGGAAARVRAGVRDAGGPGLPARRARRRWRRRSRATTARRRWRRSSPTCLRSTRPRSPRCAGRRCGARGSRRRDTWHARPARRTRSARARRPHGAGPVPARDRDGATARALDARRARGGAGQLVARAARPRSRRDGHRPRPVRGRGPRVVQRFRWNVKANFAPFSRDSSVISPFAPR